MPKVTILTKPPSDRFPLPSEFLSKYSRHLHYLQGSLWIKDGDIHMFCQVDFGTFTMMGLKSGNRNIAPFDPFEVPYSSLKEYTRFRGEISITGE
tara:strand:+ start:1524 stop:1808 length:285 start_codon:yes stop_codon:yes gene_type:complete